MKVYGLGLHAKLCLVLELIEDGGFGGRFGVSLLEPLQQLVGRSDVGDVVGLTPCDAVLVFGQILRVRTVHSAASQCSLCMNDVLNLSCQQHGMHMRRQHAMRTIGMHMRRQHAMRTIADTQQQALASGQDTCA